MSFLFLKLHFSKKLKHVALFKHFVNIPPPKNNNKKETYPRKKTLPYPLMVWKILNPFVGAGMVGFHLLFWLDFLNFGTPKSGTIIQFDLRLLVQMGWWKNHQLGCGIMVGCGVFFGSIFFCVWILLSICGRWVTWTMFSSTWFW